MSNLENLIAKILNDCESRAKDIIAEAEEKAKCIIADKLALAEKESRIVQAQAQALALSTKENIVAQAKLKIRDDILSAKREMIDRVCMLALSQLNELPDDKFVGFVNRAISTQQLTGNEQIIVPEKYKKLSFDLKVSSDTRKISGGFILVAEGVEINNTFKSLLSFYRDEIEDLIVQNLFS